MCPSCNLSKVPRLEAARTLEMPPAPTVNPSSPCIIHLIFLGVSFAGSYSQASELFWHPGYLGLERLPERDHS
jgi:hypothetical protein